MSLFMPFGPSEVRVKSGTKGPSQFNRNRMRFKIVLRAGLLIRRRNLETALTGKFFAGAQVLDDCFFAFQHFGSILSRRR